MINACPVILLKPDFLVLSEARSMMGRVPARYLRAESVFYWIRQEKKSRRRDVAKLQSHTGPIIHVSANLPQPLQQQKGNLGSNPEEMSLVCGLSNKAESVPQLPPMEITLVKSLIDLTESSEVGRTDVSVVVSVDEYACDTEVVEIANKDVRGEMDDFTCLVPLDSAEWIDSKEADGDGENTCAEAESIDSIIKEVDKYLGPLGYGCSGRRNEVPKVWYRMEHAERYDIMKRVRSELNRLGLCSVQIDYHKNKHFVKYAEVLDRVRGERMVVCACSALVPTYRTKDGWDHAMC